MIKQVLIKLSLVLVLLGGMVPLFVPVAVKADGGIIIDHSTADITQIPQYWIIKAKNDLHIGYGHRSHGWQLTSGMTGLVAFANNHGKGLNMPQNIYAYGTNTTLDLYENPNGSGEGTWLRGDCGTTPSANEGFGYWADNTRAYLTAHPECNVIIWAWCWELINDYRNTDSGTRWIQKYYLDAMNKLETDYGNVTFVYMTGHVPDHLEDYSAYGGQADPHDYAENTAANNLIRSFFNSDNHTNKALYDFADIESYNPDGVHYNYPAVNADYYATANSTTPTGNWGVEWRNNHTAGVDWYYWYGTTTSALHTDCLNGNQKAYAAWWLWARLAGWDGTPNRAPVSNAQSASTSLNTSLPITLTATDDDGDGPYLKYNIITPPAHGTLAAGSNNSSVTYTPTAGYSGSDSFSFRTNDGIANSNTATVSITVGTAPTVISITLTDAGTAGVNFGTCNAGATNVLDAGANITAPSIIITVGNDTTVNVDLQIKGSNFSTNFTIANAMYSTSYNGTKYPMSTNYITFASNIAPNSTASLWHWLSVPSSGVSTGTYGSTFSYKAIAHSGQ